MGSFLYKHCMQLLFTDNETSGWKEAAGMYSKRSFTKPCDWYFRTLDDWHCLFAGAGLKVAAIKEPLHPQVQKPLALIFVLQLQKPV